MEVANDVEVEDLARIFNSKPKDGINKIIALSKDRGCLPELQISQFFKEQKHNLDLEAVGDYLGTDSEINKKVLSHFTDNMNFKGQSFTSSLRSFLKEFKLPGEAQKIDRLVESFSHKYCEQNPELVNGKDSAYILAFQTIMLNTDLHNPSIKADGKMTFEGLKRNLRGANNKGDFDPVFLKTIYDEIKKKPFELNFRKTPPGISFTSSKKEVSEVIAQIKDNNFYVTETSKPKSWLARLTGHKMEIIIQDKEGEDIHGNKAGGGQASLQIYNPGWFSFKKPTIIIQPQALVEKEKLEQEQLNLKLAVKLANNFSAHHKTVKATYDYHKKEIENSLAPRSFVKRMQRAEPMKKPSSTAHLLVSENPLKSRSK